MRTFRSPLLGSVTLCSAAVINAVFVACGGRVSDRVDPADSSGSSTASTAAAAGSDGSLGSAEPSASYGTGFGATGADADDGGTADLDAAKVWSSDCPPPLDPYWDGVFSAGWDGSVCGVVQGASCGSAIVTGAYYCAWYARQQAGLPTACPQAVCVSPVQCWMGSGLCMMFSPTAPDGAPVPVLDDHGNCLLDPNAPSQVGCTNGGRPPAGFAGAVVVARTFAGAFFARQAVLETASVVAFDELARELTLLGAPDDLVAACKRAAREEASHAQSTSELAAAFGGAFEEPRIESSAPRTLARLAVDNAADGLVRETFSAAVAAHQAHAAAAPSVRGRMTVIARDEISHADLSRRIHVWAMSGLNAAERDAVRRAMADSIAALERELAQSGRSLCVTRDDEASRALIGAPAPEAAREMHASLVRDLWSREVAA